MQRTHAPGGIGFTMAALLSPTSRTALAQGGRPPTPRILWRRGVGFSNSGSFGHYIQAAKYSCRMSDAQESWSRWLRSLHAPLRWNLGTTSCRAERCAKHRREMIPAQSVRSSEYTCMCLDVSLGVSACGGRTEVTTTTWRVTQVMRYHFQQLRTYTDCRLPDFLSFVDAPLWRLW